MIFQNLSLASISLGLGLCLIPPSTLLAQTPETSICARELPRAIEHLIQHQEDWQRRAHWGILIQPLNSSIPLYTLNASAYFTPASNTKILTTAAALHQLGADFRIRTSVYGTGTPPNLTRLRIIGRGDPTLTNTQLQDLAQQLSRQGVRQIEELVLEDHYFTSLPINPTWEYEDVHYGYAVSVNSLILNENAFKLTLRPQKIGEPVQVNWEDNLAVQQWQIVNDGVTAPIGTELSLDIQGVLGQPILEIKGEIAADAQPDQWSIAILNPAAYFLASLTNALRTEGIEVKSARIGSEMSQSGLMKERELAFIESRPLGDLIKETNQNSNNLYAEVLRQTLGVNSSQRSHPEAAILALEGALQELGVKDNSYYLVDGSGLSRQNLISPEAIVQTLQGIAQTPQGEIFRASLPVAGVSGTLEGRFLDTPLAGHLQAKTGTLTGVSALSGYMDIPEYSTLVFSIIVNQANIAAPQQRAIIDQIILLLARSVTC